MRVESELQALEEIAEQFCGIDFEPTRRRLTYSPTFIFDEETGKRGRAKASSAPRWKRSLRAIRGQGGRRRRERIKDGLMMHKKTPPRRAATRLRQNKRYATTNRAAAVPAMGSDWDWGLDSDLGSGCWDLPA